MPVLLTPIEQAVLSRCTGGIRLEELHIELREYEPESINSTLKWLRRRQCVQHDFGRWTPTELGARVLARHLALQRRETRIRAVD